MIPLILLAHSVSISPSPNLHSFTRRSFALANSPPTLGFVNRNSRIHFNLLRFSPTPNPDFKLVEAVRFDGPILDIGKMETADNCELVIETCITRTLPQALTLERGLESIKEALEELKFNHSAPSSGVWRFQVAVPPSPKALKWFCCQPESSGVFPQFFLSKETENPSCKSLHLNGTRGVFGIGAAIYFMQSSSHTSQGQILSSRYVSSDSFDIATYGFMDVKFDTASSSIKHEAGSFYLVIPEIELDEHEDVSILSATLAWDDAFFRSFEQAIQSLESSIYQTSQHCWPSGEGCSKDCIRAALNKVNLVEDKNLKMVSSNALLLHRRDCEEDDLLELRSFCQFYFRHSPNISASNNMMDHAGETRYSLLDCTNMNAVWATLIVEECSRLGLTYFCIAPGSRSSPLAIAASTHPLTTCIACFDERSLAFHAVGYARGSHKPAVVITSSGTAVSNLLPAVVEASQDFVPLLLLTADRPPELQSAGANQSINQVNHFGSFVRFFFSLPTPTDNIPARMVLTTLDSAIHWSICSPYGPVHINCPFREPLDDSPRKWMSNCLKGLDIWMSSAEPFTKYIQMPNSLARDGDYCFPMSQIFEIIQGAERGLLLLGAIHTEDEIWAALLLAKDLNWPVVADILSGLRLRKLISCFPDVEQKIFFVDHLDHALLSDLVRGWVRFNVVIQIGSRITSRRISQMLEDCYPCSYILVDNHPCRHDPSHFVTHRVHCSILQFVDSLLKAQLPCKSSNWCYHLRALDWMVGQEISFQIFAENSLTEPHVARVISAALSAESALFIGNSMAIRDADMYGCSYKNRSNSISEMLLNSELQCLGIRVAGNRGASGIDGLLSTAIGFAVGCNKRVFCVIGDVSFLHDTNGLSILNSRMSRQPMTIILINNQGGGIFSFLPIADRIDKKILHQYFYTSHNISIYQLCRAHSVRHLQVKTKVELQDALLTTQLEKTDCVIEVQSCISVNSTFHSTLGQFACQAAEHGLNILSRPSVSFSSADQFFLCKIFKMEYSLYRIQLCAPPTSALVDQGHNVVHKEGYILSLYLEDGSIGYGEVAPIEIHKESFLDVEEQLRFLVHVIKGTKISFSLPLLKGGFSFWIWNNLGIPENSIFPSVRLGLEMAILNAIAEREDSGLLNIIQQQREKEEIYEKSTVRICGLIDSIGTPAEVAYIASSLVEEGFSALKLKVARRINPTQDATVIQEVRRKVGRQIELRVDANRNWSYKDAIQFSSLVKNCDLQYIEEPVQDEDDIIKYCEESGLPVALDETVNKFCENPLDILVKYAHPGIVAVVIKPSVVGGFERAALIAKWAHQQGKMAVVSAAYESGLGLLAYIQFSYYLELQNADLCRVMNRKFQPAVAHGLGTYRWLKQDVTTQSLGVHQIPCSGFIGVSVADAIDLLRRFQINQNVIQRTFAEEQVFTYNLTVNSKDFSCSIKVHEMGRENNDNVVIFLHGFLGTGEDWISIMNAISGSARCISIDLPGHGGSKIQNYCSKEAKQETALSVEIVSDLLYKLTQDITPGKVTLVGYSMGARIALHMALMHVNKINGAVIISGSPGLKDEMARKIRQAEDVSRSHMLIAYGLQIFLDSWYAGDLWNSLRSHPCFKDIVASRLSHDDVFSLAKVLSDLSVGRQISLWEDLKQCKIPLLLVVGEKDRKFKAISQKMCSEIGQLRKDRSSAGTIIPEIVEVPSCGHAVHIENPLPVVSAVSQFLTSLRKYTTPEHSEEER